MTSKGSLEFPLKPLPGSSDDPETAATAITIPDSDEARSKSTTLRTLLAVFLLVGVVAAVGICTVVFTPSRRSTESEDRTDPEAHVPSSVNEQNLEMNERRLVSNAKYIRSRPSYNGRARRASGDDCISEESNDTIPAAHIKGRGKFDKISEPPAPFTGNDPSYIAGYETNWRCSDHRGNAFVDGGMKFNQTDNRLYVPKCGYYYLSSQVYFKLSETETRVVQHQLRVERNCLEPDYNNFHIEGLSAVPAVDEDTSNSQTGTRPTNRDVTTATYTGEMVKLCAGGSIYIQIPESVPCCADGRFEHITFFGAVLIAETNCDWPPETPVA